MGKTVNVFLASVVFLICIGSHVLAAPINQVPYSTIGPNLVDFEDVAAAPFSGIIYDGILVSGGVSFAERFVGQTLSFIDFPSDGSGDFDVLSGSPTGPLTLQVGATNQNLDASTTNGTHDLLGCGKKGCTDPEGFAEGSIALLFPGPVSQLGYQGFFGNPVLNNTVVQFFRSDGSLIASLAVAAGGSFGFMREGSVKDIAGVSIHTSDPGGLIYDNFKFDEPGSPIPEPSTLLFLGSGLAALIGLGRRRR